jgi:protein kinase C substrate 80K-H
MIPWAFVLSLSLAATAFKPETKTAGVSPELLSKYVSSASGTWKCLDGSKEIPWDFVNDDSCDCPDGSDEPGTGACPDTRFYCWNEGHIGSSIPSSRVNDGLCEPECCDGSDEPAGVCPNACKEIGEAHRKKRDAELKIQRTGAKIRSSYITFAHKEKQRLEVDVERLSNEITEKELEVKRLEDIADRAESLSQAALEEKKQSPLYQSLMKHHHALVSLQREYKKLIDRDHNLGLVLSSLRTGYNPNYQDMAVLEAVRGWETIAGLPHINDVGKDKPTEGEAVTTETVQLEEGVPGEWTKARLDTELDDLINTDHVSLLLAHDEHVNEPLETSILFEISNYLPDSLVPAYEQSRDILMSWLTKLGIARSPAPSSSSESSRARQAFYDAERELNDLNSEKEQKERDLNKIFTVDGFGNQGEWKKLDGTCLEIESGDYVYEVCLFKEVKQKPLRGGQEFSLGRFESWNPASDVQPGTPEYYKKQVYKHGTRCWNGPERNTVVLLECGTENRLHTVQELEKCEYQITGTSPALCLPLEGDKWTKDRLKEEL